MNNLEDTLRIFDSSLHDRLRRYIASERRQALSWSPEQFAEMGLQELMYLLAEDSIESFGISSPADFDSIDNTDFESAVKQLGEFIKTNFKLEEIFEYS